MATRYDIEFTRTYASVANAEKAVAKVTDKLTDTFRLRYMILPTIQDDGSIRYGVVFFGREAVEFRMFNWFNVIA
jgi:hypothetical protein